MVWASAWTTIILVHSIPMISDFSKFNEKYHGYRPSFKSTDYNEKEGEKCILASIISAQLCAIVAGPNSIMIPFKDVF